MLGITGLPKAELNTKNSTKPQPQPNDSSAVGSVFGLQHDSLGN